MKKTLLTLALTVATVAAFAQGKISLLNDATRSVTWLADGTAVQNTGQGATLLIDLYGGADAASMVLQTTTVISAAPGLFGPYNFISPNLAGGVTATMQIQIRQTGFATAALAQAGGGLYAFGPIFTFRPSSTIAYNSIINAGGTALSTWAPGNIVVGVPEPSSMALAGIGAASLLLFRRRK
jgi:hypothetical protein